MVLYACTWSMVSIPGPLQMSKKDPILQQVLGSMFINDICPVLARLLRKTVPSSAVLEFQTRDTWAALLHTLPFSSSSFNPTPPFNSIIIPTMQNHIRVNTRRSPLKALPKHDKFCAEEEGSKFKLAPPSSTLQVNDPQQYSPSQGGVKDIRYPHSGVTAEGAG